jgi:nucleotide-binding universal stress UspA family protein
MTTPIVEKATEQRIIVGIDGSNGSKSALRWAMTQAGLTGASIEAIATWRDPTLMGYPYGYVPTPIPEDRYAALTKKVLDATIAEVSAQFDQPVEVHARVLHGPAALMLLEAAADTQMLVVGSRGHGAFAGMLLGSVSQYCVQHLTCPVVVIPPPQTEDDS